MGQERRLLGYTASPGYAAGCILRLSDTVPRDREEAGSPQEECARLSAALGKVGEELSGLASKLTEETVAGLVDFQTSMLEDETLVQPVMDAIADGAPACRAWRRAAEERVARYRAADDPYFIARGVDLADLRDRVLRTLSGVGEEPIPPDTIVVADDLSPARFLTASWVRSGIALHGATPAAHIAVLARSRGVPLIVGMGRSEGAMAGPALLDATRGVLALSPSAETRQRFEADRKAAQARARRDSDNASKPAVTASGRSVPLYINVAGLSDLDTIEVTQCDGIGLVRSEFLFPANAPPPDEETQHAVYRRLVDWAQGRPVTIRLLDAGGDKPIPGVTLDKEGNAFLGVRGVRLLLMKPSLLKAQLRAILRAAAHGPVRISVPMVTVSAEMAQVRALLEEAEADVRAAGHAAGGVQLGMMVEVPAAALTIEDFDCDFYAIGSNDLVQYATACDRNAPGLNHLTAPDGKAILRLMKMVAAVGAATGREVSVCGDMAGESRFTEALLDCGVTALSVTPNALAAVKRAVSKHGGSSR